MAIRTRLIVTLYVHCLSCTYFLQATILTALKLSNNLNSIMLCYVILCYGMLCYVMLQFQDLTHLKSSWCGFENVFSDHNGQEQH